VVGLNGWVHAGANGAFPMHAIEHVLSGLYDVPHGAGLAVVLPAWIRAAYPWRMRKYVQFAHRIFGLAGGAGEKEGGVGPGGAASSGQAPVVEAAVRELEAYMRSVGAPLRLQDLGISPGSAGEIADEVLRLNADRSGRLPGRPALDREGLLRLLAHASVD
jgi:alcohol dehydrogenase